MIAVIDDIEVENSTRLTDFCRVGVAVEQVMGWPEGAFMKAIKEMQAQAMDMALDADVIAVGIKKVMETRKNWSGTAEDLLRIMNRCCNFELSTQPKWPTSARSLGIRLVKALPPLREQGIDIQKTKSNARIITITNANTLIAFTRSHRSSNIEQFDAT